MALLELEFLENTLCTKNSLWINLWYLRTIVVSLSPVAVFKESAITFADGWNILINFKSLLKLLLLIGVGICHSLRRKLPRTLRPPKIVIGQYLRLRKLYSLHLQNC